MANCTWPGSASTRRCSKPASPGRAAEETVRLLVTSYIDWVVANPDWARFILHSRGR